MEGLDGIIVGRIEAINGAILIRGAKYGIPDQIDNLVRFQTLVDGPLVVIETFLQEKVGTMIVEGLSHLPVQIGDHITGSSTEWDMWKARSTRDVGLRSAFNFLDALVLGVEHKTYGSKYKILHVRVQAS